ADDVGIAAKPFLPQAVTEHRGARGSEMIVRGFEQTSALSVDAEKLKEIPIDHAAVESLRAIYAGESEYKTARRSHAGKRLGSRAPIFVVRVRSRNPLSFSGFLTEQDQLLGPVVRQWTKQQGADHAEDCGVRADSQGQRDDGDHSEARLLHQHPRAISKVL